MTTTTPTHDKVQRDFQRPPLARLSVIELRKVLDTRSGRWFLSAIAALVVVALANYLIQADGPFALADALRDPTSVLRLLLPALGVLSMTGEWTTRTALTTFTLVPQRGRVLAAKLTALLTITIAVMLLTTATCALGVGVTAAVTGRRADFSDAGAGAGQMLIVVGLWMLMAAGIGALLHSTAAALVAFLVFPVAVSGAAVIALGADHAAWVNIVLAINDVADLPLDDPIGPPLTAIVLWVVVPLIAGTVRTLRRQVS